ncbi:MAG: hypothetical protein IIC33_04030 [Chloroflexi bacterium]|nr:hypothetical protein [Chloroflexota bacterium]
MDRQKGALDERRLELDAQKALADVAGKDADRQASLDEKTLAAGFPAGFKLDDFREEIAEKLKAAGSEPRDDINRALGVGMPGARHANVEVKYSGPNGEILDVSETGWVGTRGFD